MKNIIAFLALFAIPFTSLAQQNYTITGRTEGKEDSINKYIYLFDNSYNTIAKQIIHNGKFVFEGTYKLNQKFGEIPFAIIYISDQDTLVDKKLISTGKIRRIIMMEPHIEISYNTEKHDFIVKGGGLNEMQTRFADNDQQSKRKIDSAFLSIDSQNLTADSKSREKFLVKEKIIHQKDISEIELIELNPDSEVALFHFSRFAIVPIVWFERTKTTYNSFSDRVKATEFYKHLKQDIDAQDDWQSVKLFSKLKIGDQMPVFKLKSSKGDSVLSKNVYGKYTLIDFWASWCVPCKKEIPYIKSAYDHFNQKGFRVIAVSTDFEKNIDQWLAAIASNGSEEFTNLLNSFGTPGIVKDLGIYMIPANYLINDKGEIVAINLRGNDLNDKLLGLYNVKKTD